MTDIIATRDPTGELAVVHVEGQTEQGIEFVDAWNAADLVAVDSGRIVIPDEALDRLTREANEADLTLVVAVPVDES